MSWLGKSSATILIVLLAAIIQLYINEDFAGIFQNLNVRSPIAVQENDLGCGTEEVDSDAPPKTCACSTDGDTIFAYHGNNPGDSFLSLGIATRWGWQLGPLVVGETDLSFPLYAGAGQNDLTKGTIVGNFYVTYYYNEGEVPTLRLFWNGTSECDPFCGYQIYVGYVSSTTAAPGQYRVLGENLNSERCDGVASDSLVISGLSGQSVYIIFHSTFRTGACSCPPPPPPPPAPSVTPLVYTSTIINTVSLWGSTTVPVTSTATQFIVYSSTIATPVTTYNTYYSTERYYSSVPVTSVVPRQCQCDPSNEVPGGVEVVCQCCVDLLERVNCQDRYTYTTSVAAATSTVFADPTTITAGPYTSTATSVSTTVATMVYTSSVTSPTTITSVQTTVSISIIPPQTVRNDYTYTLAGQTVTVTTSYICETTGYSVHLPPTVTCSGTRPARTSTTIQGTPTLLPEPAWDFESIKGKNCSVTPSRPAEVLHLPERDCVGFGLEGFLSVFVYGDYFASSDVAGRVAVGGKAVLADGFSAGDQLKGLEMCAEATFIVGKTIVWNSGRNYFGGIIGIKEGSSLNPSVLAQGSGIQCSFTENRSFFDFEGTYKRLIALSIFWRDVQSYAIATLGYEWTTLTINIQGSAPVAVLTIGDGLFLLENVRNIEITNAKPGMLLVINILGRKSGFQSMNMESLRYINVLFNFVDAEVLQISGVAVRGRILAPLAVVTGATGVIYGSIYVKALSGPIQVQKTSFPVCPGGADEKRDFMLPIEADKKVSGAVDLVAFMGMSTLVTVIVGLFFLTR